MTLSQTMTFPGGSGKELRTPVSDVLKEKITSITEVSRKQVTAFFQETAYYGMWLYWTKETKSKIKSGGTDMLDKEDFVAAFKPWSKDKNGKIKINKHAMINIGATVGGMLLGTAIFLVACGRARGGGSTSGQDGNVDSLCTNLIKMAADN
ncbi:MAG: hypothetical protein AAB580_02760, partial [Patescibacteria group bacterium]